MTRIIAFSSFLILLPVFYVDYWQMSLPHETLSTFTQIADNPRELILGLLIGYPLMFVSGHALWFACRAFNFVMRKLA
jgi:hypothetical protein